MIVILGLSKNFLTELRFQSCCLLLERNIVGIGTKLIYECVNIMVTCRLLDK